jgi:hypothetical protein
MHLKGRRNFLGIVSGSAAGVCAGGCLPVTAAPGPKAWTEKDKIDIGSRGPEIIKRAYQLGVEYHSKYGNCAQTSVAALQDSVPFVPKDELVFMAASPLSGGATRTRAANCGAFTCSGLVIGSLCGRTRANFAGKAPLPGELILPLSDRIGETWGGVLCNLIRPKVAGRCPEVVGLIASWTAEILLRQFANHGA